MSYPYLNYINFLITKRFTYDKIKEISEGHGLLCPSEEEIKIFTDNIIERCPVPALKKIITTKQKKINDVDKFLEYMKVLGVQELWLSESNFKNDKSMASVMRALDIFENNRYRLEMNCFLLNRADPSDIAQCFQQKHQYYLTQGAVEKYSKLFFDITKMNKKSWVKYLQAICNRDQRLYLVAMNEDSNRIRYELGFKTRLEYFDVLNDVFSVSYYKFKEFSKLGSDDYSHRNARAWAKTLLDAGDRKEKIQAGSMEDFSESLQMEFVFDNEEFPSYSDLK